MTSISSMVIMPGMVGMATTTTSTRTRRDRESIWS
jgi:hypothetical protein